MCFYPPQTIPILSRTKTLVLFLFVFACFMLLAWRTEHNAHQIRVTQWESCVGGVQILDRFNQQQEKLAQIERDQHLAPEIAKRRIEVYQQGRFLPLKDCGPRP